MTKFDTLKPYTKRHIEDYGAYPSPDYKSFENKYRNFLKRVCLSHDYVLKFCGSHYEFSCFVTNERNGKCVYIRISDVRYFKNEWWNHILIRSAQNDHDYTGGANQYTALPELESRIVQMVE